MRFCPFCSAENADDLQVCSACGRRLPPLPPRRARNAPPTGVQLPPRSTAPGPRRTDQTGAITPVIEPSATAPMPRVAPPDATTAVQAKPPTPTAAEIQADDAARRQLLDAITPGPAAQRREPPPAAAAAAADPLRRRTDSKAPPLRSDITGAANRNNAAAMVPPRPAPADADPHVEGPTARYPQRAESEAAFVDEEPDVVTRLNDVRPPPVPSRTMPLAPPGPPTPPSVTKQTMLGTPTSMSAAAPQLTPTSMVAPAPPPGPTTGPRTAPTMTAALAAVRPPSMSAAMPIAAPRAPITPADPPPTRVLRPDQLVDRPFAPPKVLPIPEIPEPGLVNAAKYATRFWRARMQRRGAIKVLGVEIKQDTEALDQVLGALGREARTAGVEGRVFSAENAAISTAEERVQQLHREHTEVDARKADESSKFVDVERERNTKLAEAERAVEEAQRELQAFETQRRTLRDKRKELERRQRAYLKAAEDHDRSSGAAQSTDQRSELRRAAEGSRREAAALEPDRQEIDRRLASLERPIGEATAKLDAAKAELDAAKRSLGDAREGHTHRLAELDAEHKRKSREIALAESEISRRLVTLGTLVNLNRIEDPRFGELYQRIDRLRGAITARTTEIEKLTAERDAYDRGMLVRGVTVIGGAIVALIALIVILRAIL